MSYDNLIKISSYLEKYEEQYPGDIQIEDFAYWLSEHVTKKPRSGKAIISGNNNLVKLQSNDVQISILIGRMYKFARFYTKKILSDGPLNGLDDYSFMATLMFYDSMTKSELTHHNIMDSATSGAEIIKRLVKNGLIDEFNDSTDKRSRRIKITKKGKLLMFEVFEKMNGVSNIITGNLDNDEKLFFLSYLNKLDALHKEVYTNDRKSDLKIIEAKYIK